MENQEDTKFQKDDNFQQEIHEATLQTYEKLLIEPLEKFYKTNYFWSKFWFFIYIIIGLTVVIFNSTSAIITFYNFSNNTILFPIVCCSTISTFMLTFLNPSGRAFTRKIAARQSSSLLTQVKKDRNLINVIPSLDSSKKASYLIDQYRELIENYHQ